MSDLIFKYIATNILKEKLQLTPQIIPYATPDLYITDIQTPYIQIPYDAAILSGDTNIHVEAPKEKGQLLIVEIAVALTSDSPNISLVDFFDPRSQSQKIANQSITTHPLGSLFIFLLSNDTYWNSLFVIFNGSIF